jgi:hypothetical protein
MSSSLSMRCHMLDVAYAVVGAGFLALCWLFVKACERL